MYTGRRRSVHGLHVHGGGRRQGSDRRQGLGQGYSDEYNVSCYVAEATQTTEANAKAEAKAETDAMAEATVIDTRPMPIATRLSLS